MSYTSLAQSAVQLCIIKHEFFIEKMYLKTHLFLTHFGNTIDFYVQPVAT